MRLKPEEKSSLEELYLHYAIPTDQLRRNAVVLGRITAAFNRLNDCEVDPPEILRYMINRRKNADWPRLEDRAKRFSSAMAELLEGEIDVLVGAYVAINVPLDEYLLRDGLGARLAQGFAMATKRTLPIPTLVAALMAYRKRGLLPCLVEVKTVGTAEPFADIDVVAKMNRQRFGG